MGALENYRFGILFLKPAGVRKLAPEAPIRQFSGR